MESSTDRLKRNAMVNSEINTMNANNLDNSDEDFVLVDFIGTTSQTDFQSSKDNNENLKTFEGNQKQSIMTQ